MPNYMRTTQSREMRILSKKEDNMVSSTSFGVADGIPDDEDYSVNETKSNQNKRIKSAYKGG